MRLMPLALFLAMPLAAGCGKERNDSNPRVIDLVHAFPEAPRALTVNRATAWDSGRALAVSDASLFAADRDNRALVQIDRQSLAPTATLALGGTPEQLVRLPDGNIYVTLRDTGEVLRIAADFTIAQRIQVGQDAFGIAVLAEGDHIGSLYVTLATESAVVTLDRSLQVVQRTSTDPLPRGLVVTASRTLVVTHQNADAKRFPIDPAGLLEADEIDFPLRRQNPDDLAFGTSTPRAGGMNITAGRAVTLNPETGEPLIAHSLAFTGTVFNPFGGVEAARSPQPAYYTDTTGTAGTTGGTVMTPLPIEVTVSGVEPEIELPVNDPLSGMPMSQLVDQPSDILHHPQKTLLFVTGYGTDNVLVLSTAHGDPMRSPLALIDVGHAPTAIGFSPDGRTAYVLNSQQFSISQIDLEPLLNLAPDAEATATQRLVGDDGSLFLSTFDQSVGATTYRWSLDGSPRTRPLHLGVQTTKTFARDPLTPAARHGVRLFTFTHNDEISRAGSFACSSCHIDGGDDRLVWVTSDGPRQTPALAGRLADTAPYSWNGEREELQANMQATVARMGGKGMPQHDLDDLERYIRDDLVVPNNPFIASGELTPQQARGQAIFQSPEAQCGSCHRLDQGITDGLSHDVGTASQLDQARFEADVAAGVASPHPAGLFDTPSLRGLYYTAPYFHDGSAPTLADVLARTGDSMGHSSQLSPEDREALIAYLLTL